MILLPIISQYECRGNMKMHGDRSCGECSGRSSGGEPKDGEIREHASKQDGYHRFGLTADAAEEDGNEPDTLRISTGGLQDARAEYL